MGVLPVGRSFTCRPWFYTNENTHRFLEEARGSLSGLPSVRRVSYGIRLPAQGNEAGWSSEFVVPGKEPPPGEETFRIRYTMVGPDYFEVMGTRILAGRGIQASDTPESEPVAVVSQTMASFPPFARPASTRRSPCARSESPRSLHQTGGVIGDGRDLLVESMPPAPSFSRIS